MAKGRRGEEEDGDEEEGEGGEGGSGGISKGGKKAAAQQQKRLVEVAPSMSVDGLATALGVKSHELLLKYEEVQGKKLNRSDILTKEEAEYLILEFGAEPIALVEKPQFVDAVRRCVGDMKQMRDRDKGSRSNAFTHSFDFLALSSHQSHSSRRLSVAQASASRHNHGPCRYVFGHWLYFGLRACVCPSPR